MFTQRCGAGRLSGGVILTTFNDDRAVYSALRAGASGFILKSAARRELVAAIRALSEGAGWLDRRSSRASSWSISRPSLTPCSPRSMTSRV